MSTAVFEAPTRAEPKAISRPTDRDAVPPFPVRRLSVEQYHEIARAGILNEDDRVELLEGWLVTKMTHNVPHAFALELTLDVLRALLPDAWRIRVQLPVTTGDSEPEPDLAVVRGPKERYSQRHPGREDVGLLIEITDTSLVRDRWKAKIYARAGIPAYWLVNLIDDQVEAYSQPAGEGEAAAYRDKRVLRRGGELRFSLDGVEFGPIRCDELLPPSDGGAQ
jgi:Uma2 family endonuclease